jgi:hypothetical protein
MVNVGHLKDWDFTMKNGDVPSGYVKIAIEHGHS